MRIADPPFLMGSDFAGTPRRR